MKRLAKFDVSRGIVQPRVRLLAQLLFGIGCALAMIGLRSLLDLWVPTSGPFAMVYPTIVIATLYGHLPAGIVAYLTSFVWTWYYVLAPTHGFQFEDPTDASRVTINALSTLVVLLLAEGFRRAVASAMAERDKEIERGEVLLQELEHRTKNNFALATSLLEMQRRRETSAEVKQALEHAIARIHSFAAAYANLAQSQGEGAQVSMRPFLEEIVKRVQGGAFSDDVKLELTAAECTMPREVAVAIGLFTNEALTNCAKYAFPDGRKGRVEVRFDGEPEGWRLHIADDGVGNGSGNKNSTGIGTRLMEAFARQAEAEFELDVSEQGRRLRLVSAN